MLLGSAQGKRGMTMKIEDVLREIRSRPTVPLWPHVALALRMSRGSVYEAARRGEIDIVRYGRLIRAVTSPLRKRLGLDDAA